MILTKKQTCHSEVGELYSVFLKSARSAFKNQENIDHQWKELNYISCPDYNQVIKEYEAFETLLKSDNCKANYFDSDLESSMDAVYCRDASIATDFGMIICTMGKEARKQESNAQELSYKSHGIPILGRIEAPGTMEGGDLAWLDYKTLAVGHTYRTNLEGIRQLKAMLEPHGINMITVYLPHYKGKIDVFHLMSILSPVDKDLAVVYSPLMPIQFRNQLLEKGYQFVEVPDKEFESMGCNVLAFSPRNCIMVAGNPITKSKLESAGCHVQEYEGNHLSVMGGGGPTCLTRPIRRGSPTGYLDSV